MKRTPIVVRILIAMYLVTICGSTITAWISASVAKEQVEKQLVHDMARNTAGLLSQLNLPPGNGVMRNLSEIFGGEVLAGPSGYLEINGSSLDIEATRQFISQLPSCLKTRSARIGDTAYAVGYEDFASTTGTLTTRKTIRLYLLVPHDRIAAAQKAVVQRIFLYAALVMLVATFIGAVLSITITRPLHRLSQQLDQLSKEAEKASGTAVDLTIPTPENGPREVAELTKSFDRLLTSLNHAQNQLAHVERLAALGKVAASVAHEMRNPLSGVKMHIRLLKDMCSDADQDTQDSLQIVDNEVDRMDLFLEEMMSLSKRPEKVSEDNRPYVPVDLSHEARQVIRLISGKFDHSGITLVTDFADALPVVHGDSGRLRQVIMNLLLNAAEAAPESSEVTVSTSVRRNCVRLAVRDCGKGVEEQENDIFDAFVTTKFSGGGLGLYVCRQIADEHDGSMGYNNCDPGAEFWLELPMAAHETKETDV